MSSPTSNLIRALELIREVYLVHRDEESYDSDWENGTDVPCAWCEDAAELFKDCAYDPHD